VFTKIPTKPQTDTITNKATIPKMIKPFASSVLVVSPPAVTYLRRPAIKTRTARPIITGIIALIALL
jgi:hypothetical protein